MKKNQLVEFVVVVVVVVVVAFAVVVVAVAVAGDFAAVAVVAALPHYFI